MKILVIHTEVSLTLKEHMPMQLYVTYVMGDGWVPFLKETGGFLNQTESKGMSAGSEWR